MVTITFIQKDGVSRQGVASGGSVMELARANGVRGIDGQCGGCVSCGTCHVQIPPEWIDRIGRASASEVDILEFEADFTENSRLSCQIAVTPAIDGLVVHVMGKS